MIRLSDHDGFWRYLYRLELSYGEPPLLGKFTVLCPESQQGSMRRNVFVCNCIPKYVMHVKKSESCVGQV